jgi:hypothetical protein
MAIFLRPPIPLLARFLWAVLSVLTIIVAPTEAVAQTLPQSAAPEMPGSGVNGITQAAVQRGVLNCAARINQVTNFLGFDDNAGALLLLPPTQPDQRVLAISMELPGEKGSVLATADFAPNQANGCGAAYDAVTWWQDKCATVAEKQFGAFKKIGILKKSVTVLDGGIATKVFLMPAGSGCVSVKKEVVL